MTRTLSLPVALLLALVMIACEDDPVSEPDPPEQSDTFSTTMTGYQGPSPILSPGWGEGHFEVTDDGVDYEITVENLLGATMAHIHVGADDESGPVVADIFLFDDPQDIESETFTGTITEADLQPQEDAGFDGSFEAFLELAEDEMLYLNTHTEFNPSNDIRGQIASGADNPAPSPPSAVVYTAELDGSTEDVSTEASGEATLTWDWDDRELLYEVTLQNLDEATQAHIHRGETTGPVVSFFGADVGDNFFYTEAPDGSGEGEPQSFEEETITGTIEHAFFTEELDGSFQQLYELLRDGEAFFNVHTTENPGGEIGGQFENGAGNGNGNGDDNGGPDY